MNYQEFSQKTRSVKSIIAHMDAKRLAKIFTNDGSDVWSRIEDLFVVGVSVDGVAFVSNQSVGLGEFWYDAAQKKLSVGRVADPRLSEVVVTYRLFLSDKPYNLPSGITSGDAVEYLPLIRSIGSLKFELDYEQTGIALESNSNITLENTGAFFDEIFDTLIWENQKVDFYSWSPSLPLSEARKIYSGFIKDKSYSKNLVRFSLVDIIFALRKSIQLGEFSSLDGTLSENDLGKPKARIYGKAKTMKTVGIDKTLEGYGIGAISGTLGSNVITGNNFLANLSPEDEIIVEVSGEVERLVVEQVTSNTSLTLTRELEFNLVGVFAKASPVVPYRFKNRFWHIAGHPLHEFVCKVVEVVAPNRLRVDTVKGLEPGDIISFGSQNRSILRVSGDQIILAQSFLPAPVVSDTLTRFPVLEVFFGTKRMISNRDFFLINGSNSIIDFDNLAEFNVSPVLRVGFNMTFTNESRDVTTAADVDLKTLFKTRDWIISGDISHQVWYEILEVQEKTLVLRTAYAGTSSTSIPNRKNVEYIEDNSLITVSCFGVERDGQWIRTPSQSVRDLVLNDAGISGINEDSFNAAKEIAPYTSSMVIREEVKIRDIISDFNRSCFGSLYQKNDFSIAYSILNADKEDELEEIRDDDILDFSAKTSNAIVNRVIVNYRQFVDIFSGEDTNEIAEFSSDFVNQTSGIEQTRQVTIFLYDDLDAETIAQRIALFNSLSQSVVTVKAKLQFMLSALNDRVFISLDRLFKRYGSGSRKKIGIINSIVKTESDTQIELNDLSGVFTRVPSISPSDAVEFNLSTESERTKYGYIVDDDTLTPDNMSEEDLGNNLIG